MSSISALGGHHHHHSHQQLMQSVAASTSSSASSASGTLTALTDALNPSASSASNTPTAAQGLFKQIENAVTGALQSAPSNADPNQVVQKAIANVLKNPNSSDDGDGDISPADAAKTQKTFAQTLQSFGITPDQFQKDLAGAVQSTQSAAGTSSFPPGVFLDTTA